MLLECINTSVWNLFIIPEEDWSQSKSIEEYEVNKLKNEDGYSCFYAFVQLPGHSSKTLSNCLTLLNSIVTMKKFNKVIYSHFVINIHLALLVLCDETTCHHSLF